MRPADRPTSLLDAFTTQQLPAQVKKETVRGIAIMLILHLLGEILSTADLIG